MSLSKGFRLKNAPEPLDFRLAQAGIVMRNADGAPRPGVLYTPNADGSIATRSSSRLRLTLADLLVLALRRSALDGVDIVTNVGAVNLDFSAPTANSKYITVWARQNDSTMGDPDDLPTFGFEDGQAAASPAIPAVPTGATKIGHLLLPSGAATLQAAGVVWTETILATALAGAMLEYRSTTEMNADVANLDNGVFATVRGGDSYYTNGGTWHNFTGDTGWIAPTLLPGFSSRNNWGFRILRGTEVKWQGAVAYTDSSAPFPAGYTTFCNSLPAIAQPSQYLRTPISIYSGYTGNLVISGSRMDIGISGTSGNAIYFGGVSYMNGM